MIHVGDCREIMATLSPESMDAIVTDPPYELGFMGKGWDKTGVAFDARTWREALRIAKPGAYLCAFGASRNFHRMMVAIEDAGWEIRDTLMWVYGQGFPKSLDVAKAIDKLDRVGPMRERALQFTAWMRSTGLTARAINEATNTSMASHYLTALEQPAVPTRDLFELIRPLLSVPVPQFVEDLINSRTVESENLKRREVIGTHERTAAAAEWRHRYQPGQTAPTTEPGEITKAFTPEAQRWEGWGSALKPSWEPIVLARKPFKGSLGGNVLRHGVGAMNVDACRLEGGRWPPNLTFEDLPEIREYFPSEGGESTCRFFYCAKAAAEDRHDGVDENTHATVKPTPLMRWLCRLVTPPGGLVFDPFTGSGSTGRGAIAEGFQFAGAELDPVNAAIAEARTRVVQPGLGF